MGEERSGCKPVGAGDFRAALEAVGIRQGDIILVHSDMMAVWVPPTRPAELVPFYLEHLREAIGSEGTLAVPAYFYEYARYGSPYDTRNSPVSKPLGVFSKHIASLPEAHRSLNPVTAIAAIGARAEWICGGNTAIAFGYHSPWQRLLEAEGKMVFLGAGIQSMTFVHYVEHHAGVPHLYSKLYSMPVSRDGVVADLPVVAQVRYLDFGIEYDLGRFEADMEAAGMIMEASVGAGFIKVVDFNEVYKFLADRLQRDCYYLLARPPAFRPGQIPTDGDTGERQEVKK